MEKSIYFYKGIYKNPLEEYDLKITYKQNFLYFNDEIITIHFQVVDYYEEYDKYKERGFSKDFITFAAAFDTWLLFQSDDNLEIHEDFFNFLCSIDINIHIMVHRIIHGLLYNDDLIQDNMDFLLRNKSITYVNHNKKLNTENMDINSDNLESIYSGFLGKFKL